MCQIAVTVLTVLSLLLKHIFSKVAIKNFRSTSSPSEALAPQVGRKCGPADLFHLPPKLSPGESRTLCCHSPLFAEGDYLLRNLAQCPEIDCEIRGLVIAQHHRRGGKASAIRRPGEIGDRILGVSLP